MDVLNQLLRSLILIGVASVIFLGAGAWFLSGKSIQPASEALEKQQEFVANASHELRAPLTLVRAGIEVAKRGSADTLQQQTLSDTLMDVDYMKHLLDDLLLLSRLDAKTVKLEKELIQFPQFLDSLTRKMSLIASDAGIELSGESETFGLMADPNRLQQVIFILVDNAIRHNTPGGWVKLSAKRIQNQVQIEVADSGKGIPAEHLERVFERFYKVEDGTRSAQKGSGLGLSIARGLVEAHRGRIKLTSKPGSGTRATIILPIGSLPVSPA
jgi:signal transduction histidine kinase